MKKQNPLPFLNRIALQYDGDPLKANPIKSLKSFFDYARAAEHLQALDEFCLAALHNRYHWKRGSPGNGLYYGEQLELLVEAAWLIHQNPEKYKLKKQVAPTIPVSQLPMLLTAGEYITPVLVVEDFFTRASLSRWKKLLHAFTAAAISDYSVADEIKPADIFRFAGYFKKLICAAARLIVQQS